MQVVGFACVLIFGVTNVFLTWANAITIGLVLMYILANIGVVKYYLTEGRAQFNVLLHVIIPVVASAAGIVVVWKSYFSPFTSSGVVFWGLMVFIAVLVITIVALIYMRVTGREDWMRKAQLVYEQSGSGHWCHRHPAAGSDEAGQMREHLHRGAGVRSVRRASRQGR